MGSVLVTLFVSLAGLGLTFAEQHPGAHNRLVRRCDNETHPWFYGNETNPEPPPTEIPPPFPCGSDSCRPEGGPNPTAGNNSSPQFTFSPEQTSLGTAPSWSNTTAVQGTGQTPSPTVTSAPFANSTSTDTNAVASQITASTDNATIASAESTGSVVSPQLNSASSNGMTASDAPSVLPITVMTMRSTTTIWSIPGSNFTYNGTSPPWGTGRSTDRPLWTNTSSPAPGYTSPSETDTSPEFENTVITVTIDYTPGPITPSPVTPSPEEFTVTATVPERRNHTLPGSSNTGPALSSNTGAATVPISPQSGSLTMTIVVESNTTRVFSPSETSPSFTGWSNSSLVSAVSNAIPTDSSTQQSVNNTTADSTPSSTASSASEPTTSSLSESASSSQTNAIAFGTSTRTDDSTSAATSNTAITITSAASGNPGGIPAGVPTSLLWPNGTHPTPCSLTPSNLWQDWNWTIPTDASFTAPSSPVGPADTFSVTSFPSLSPSGVISATASEPLNNTVTPSTGTWFAVTTLSNGSVATTFSTQFGTAPADSDGGPSDPGHGGNGASASAGTSTLLAVTDHHIVIPPRRQARWASAV
ncbi:hypothetical protein PV04_07236 [Phialophora macrospora]|uniref:Uncharacterized protein n=1 Tax=Phialophora macrospora TaxID=1851006 RepID=A0A0D2CIB0_9EURO|nr:hypothetical protein PV04_07236 [Phialophora macrospora]